MLSRPRALRRFLTSLVVVAIGVVTFPQAIVHGAPIGSPVSVTRNISMTGTNISNLVYDGTYVWSVSYSSNVVERINPSTGALVGSPIAVGANPGATLIVNGHLFVANSGTNTVTDINMSTATVTRTITLTGNNIAGLVYDGTYVWAISWGSSKAERFNPSTGALVGSALNVAPNPGMGLLVDGHLFIPGSGGSTVTDINVSTATITRTITLAGSNLASIGYDGTNLWVTQFNNSNVARFSPGTGVILGYTSTGSNPTNVIFANGSIWVGATGTDTVTQIQTNGTVVRTIHLGGSNISNLVYDGAVIWAPNFNGAFISQINASTGSVDANTPTVGSNPGAVVFVDNSVFVASTGSGTVTQISGPVPTTTTSTTTTTTSTTTTTVAPTTTASPVTTVAPGSTAPTTSVASTVTTAVTGTTTVSAGSGSTTGQATNATTNSTATTAPVRSTGGTGSTTTSVAPVTTLPATTTTTLPAPDVPSVDPGEAAATVGEKSIATQISRAGNQVTIQAGDVKATISGFDGTGITQLDADGNVRVLPGQSIDLSSSGFAPNSEVDGWMFSTPYHLGTERADGTGTVNTRFTVPASLENGSHRFSLIGRTVDGFEVKLVLGIKVGKETKSHVATWLIVLPLGFAVLFAFFLPAVMRRRRTQVS